MWYCPHKRNRFPTENAGNMFECLILGDSIRVGAAKVINARYARQCDAVTATPLTISRRQAAVYWPVRRVMVPTVPTI